MAFYDIALIGGGIVGVSTALALKMKWPDAKIALIEKEAGFACRQTGHNSGVVHAGVYYQPGSLKARFCRQGAALTKSFCKEHDLPYKRCGKLLVATDSLTLSRMDDLEQRCKANNILTHRIKKNDLQRLEPGITGLCALFVPDSAITDYQRITAKMAELYKAARGILFLGKRVFAIREKTDHLCINFGATKLNARCLIACAGLEADRLARMMNIPLDFRILPFREEYYQLPRKHSRIVSHLIYPIPDPALPFLGVHLTPMVDGRVIVGPNAILGFKREGYSRMNFSLTDTMEMIQFKGFWHVVKNNLASGTKEMIDALYKPGYLKRIQKYCPAIILSDLKYYPAGIRAQAVKKDGALVHDFLFVRSKLSLHVCNSPSPAATSAFPISKYLCEMVEKQFKSVL